MQLDNQLFINKDNLTYLKSSRKCETITVEITANGCRYLTRIKL